MANSVARISYENSTDLTGTLRNSTKVTYRRVLNGRTRVGLHIWGLIMLITSLALLGWIAFGAAVNPSPLVIVAAVLMALIELIRIFQSVTLWIFARHAHDPVPMKPVPGLRVAVHTTIVPGKEPFDLVAKTLLAMKEIRYEGGSVDVWLLDEGNEPYIARWCQENGIHHFSRKDIEEWNQPSGQFKAKTKHGNLNSFHAAHGHEYDIVAQMDPDHVPSPEFLERSLGYFADPSVGFVVAPQVYGNIKESFIAHASAVQSYIFHGVIQRGANGLNAPLLIGTNHLIRTQALRDVGGYADNIIEDHLTSMALFSTKNEAGELWKGVYTPDILSVGEGPTTFSDYFSQQQRWAYGIWDIAIAHSPRTLRKMPKNQAGMFVMLQSFYPSVALTWVLSIILTGLYLTGFVHGRPMTEWLIFWVLSMTSTLGFFFWLRRFNLVEHERKDLGLSGMLLQLMCIPVYVRAGFQAVLRRKLKYAVTAKGDLASPDSLRTFGSHFGWAAVALVMLGVSFAGLGSTFFGVRFWIMWVIFVCLLGPTVWMGMNARRRTKAQQLAITAGSREAQPWIHMPKRIRKTA
ncbi:glycosyltransferase family 2 protein [Corynebacterium sp. S7]